jgi:hypothetical protein
MELNLVTNDIEVNGKKYKLQHPGNREWIRIKKTLYNVSGDSIDMEPLLDYFFEHVCFPESGSKLNLDTVPILELEEVWGSVALQFLRGTLETGYKYPNKKSSAGK